MKKLVCVILAALLLTACGTPTEATVPPETQPEAGGTGSFTENP